MTGLIVLLLDHSYQQTHAHKADYSLFMMDGIVFCVTLCSCLISVLIIHLLPSVEISTISLSSKIVTQFPEESVC